MNARFIPLWCALCLLCGLTPLAGFARGSGGVVPWEVSKNIIRIWGVSCDARLPNENPKSCFARKISLKDFQVVTQGYGGKTTLKLGEHKYTLGMGPLFQQEGDSGCVYFKFIGKQRINRDSDGVAVTSSPQWDPIEIEDGATIEHCFPLPRPDLFEPAPKKKPLSKYISPVCTLGCDVNPETGKPACAMHAAYTGDKKYLRFLTPFLSAGAQCMFETIYKMFDPDLENGVFVRIMSGFRIVVLSSMALFFTLVGLQYASLMKGNKADDVIDLFDFMWIFLKAILISTFTSPEQQGQVMSVGFIYKSALNLQTGLLSYVLDINDDDLSFKTLKNKTNIEKAHNIGKTVSTTTNDIFQIDKLTLQDFNYDYCNFNKKSFNYNNYNFIGASGNEISVNKSMYRMWDMMDCRLLNYLGFGYFDYNRDKEYKTDANSHTFPKAQAASLIIYAIILMFSYVGLGIVATVFILAFVAFVVMVFLKIFIGFASSIVILSILFIISPIVFSFAFFPLTSRMFTQWVTEILNVIIQPTIYAIFMIMFVMLTDYVYYGGNRQFNGFNNTKTEALIVGGITVDNAALADPNKITLVASGGGNFECKDPSSMACLVGYGIKSKRVMGWLGPLGFSLHVIATSSFKSVYGALLFECVKLFGIVVVFFFIHQVIEQLLQQLAVSTGGAYGLARIVNASSPIVFAVRGLRAAASWNALLPITGLVAYRALKRAALKTRPEDRAPRAGANLQSGATGNVAAGGAAGKTGRAGPQTSRLKTSEPKQPITRKEAHPESAYANILPGAPGGGTGGTSVQDLPNFPEDIPSKGKDKKPDKEKGRQQPPKGKNERQGRKEGADRRTGRDGEKPDASDPKKAPQPRTAARESTSKQEQRSNPRPEAAEYDE